MNKYSQSPYNDHDDYGYEQQSGGPGLGTLAAVLSAAALATPAGRPVRKMLGKADIGGLGAAGKAKFIDPLVDKASAYMKKGDGTLYRAWQAGKQGIADVDGDFAFKEAYRANALKEAQKLVPTTPPIDIVPRTTNDFRATPSNIRATGRSFKDFGKSILGDAKRAFGAAPEPEQLALNLGEAQALKTAKPVVRSTPVDPVEEALPGMGPVSPALVRETPAAQTQGNQLPLPLNLGPEAIDMGLPPQAILRAAEANNTGSLDFNNFLGKNLTTLTPEERIAQITKNLGTTKGKTKLAQNFDYGLSHAQEEPSAEILAALSQSIGGQNIVQEYNAAKSLPFKQGHSQKLYAAEDLSATIHALSEYAKSVTKDKGKPKTFTTMLQHYLKGIQKPQSLV